MQVAKEQGWLGESYIAEAMGIVEGGREASGGKPTRILDAIARVSALMFTAGERYTKQTIMVAEYSLILGRMKSDTKFRSKTLGKTIDTKNMPKAAREQLAAAEALWETESINGGVMLETAPKWAQQGIGRVAFMYKNFGLNLYGTMLLSAKTALDSEYGSVKDSEIRRVAIKQLVGAHGTALLFAGVHGVPLYGAVSMMADLLFYDDEEDDFDTDVRKYVEEGWYKGWVAELSGIDVSNRIKLTDLLWEENRYKPDPSTEENIVGLLGGPAFSTFERIRRGVVDLYSGEVERGIESMLPPAVANAYKASFGRYQREGGIYTRLGNPIYDDITGGELAFQALGFAPTGYTFEQERNNIISGIDRVVGKRRSFLTKQYYVASRLGGTDDLRGVLDDIRAFNKRHPRQAISGETISKSIEARMRTIERTHNGVTLSPLMYAELMESRNEWGD